MSENIEIRDMRTDGEKPLGVVEFWDARLDHSLAITTHEWEQLGKPAYVVVTVRGETFAESTP